VTSRKKLSARAFGAIFILGACVEVGATPYQFNSASGTPPQVSDQQMPEGLTSPVGESIWSQDLLTGNWGGWRDQIGYKGLSFSVNYQAEVFGNPVGGIKQGVISDGLFNLAVDLDLERVTNGIWKDALIHSNALYIYGQGLSANYVGDFSNTSNIAGPQSIRLQELWFQQSLWQKRASIRVGMLAADTEFFTSNSSALFLNGTFGAFNLIGQNFPGAPVYPLSRPGVRAYLAPTSNFYIKGAIFGMDSALDPGGNDLYGTDFNINLSDGLLWIFEAGYLVNQSPNDRGLQGTYKIGTFFQNGNFTTWHSQAEAALGVGGLSSRSTEFAIYAVADQQIYQRGDQTISVFARGGFGPPKYSFIDGYFDAGADFTGFVPNRPLDVGGLAIAYSAVSRSFSDAQILQGNPPYTEEIVLEATYQAHVAAWWNIQPDIQFILNPSGAAGSHNALVLGVRTSINF
jgi:porin